MRIGVVNRFPNGAYLLGDALGELGVDVLRVPLAECRVDAGTGVTVSNGVLPRVDGFLWRLSENVTASTAPLAEALDVLAPVVNRPAVVQLCSDKWRTFLALGQAGLPVLETVWVAPGGCIPVLGETTVVKPACGAGGRDVRLATPGAVVDLDTRESWIAQPWVGPDDLHLRVLVIDGAVVSSYQRAGAAGSAVNNIDAGGHRLPVAYPRASLRAAEELALAAATALSADIAGVDLVPGPWRVLEVNSNPGLPVSVIPAAASALAGLVRARTGR